MKIRIASRKSALAIAQTRWVEAQIHIHHPDIEFEEISITTLGDRVLDRPLAEVGGKGHFVNEVESLVASGKADIAVHSLKDVPGDVDIYEGLQFICFPKRENPHDVLLTKSGEALDDLPAGAKVGTTSARRVAQLSSLRPDLNYIGLRGNVGTRLERLDRGELDAIVLAAAGLRRLNILNTRPHYVLSSEMSIPAVGQGILAIEARVQEKKLHDIVKSIDDFGTHLEAKAERTMLRALNGNCYAPIAGFAQYSDQSIELIGFVGALDGTKRLIVNQQVKLMGSVEQQYQIASDLGLSVASELYENGAKSLIEAENHNSV